MHEGVGLDREVLAAGLAVVGLGLPVLYHRCVIQALVAAERPGQADQDGRPSGAALPAVDLSVIRGIGSSTVVPGSVGSYRSVIDGAKLRENATTILLRGRALQGVSLSSMRFHPLAGDTRTMKTDKKHGSRQESHLLLDRPAIDWPCRT